MGASDMGWLKMSDDFVNHPRIVGLSDAAFRAWLASLAYAAHWLTDGRVPAEVVTKVPRRLRVEIVAAGLWKPEPDGSVTIHDWTDYNPPANTVRERQAAERERLRRYRQRRREEGQNDET